MEHDRLKEIDVLRTVAFIFVVVQHTLGGYSFIKGLPYTSFTVMKLMYTVAKPAVSIFLFISALTLFYVYSKNFNCKSYYIKKIKYILIPYIIWSAVNMIELGNEDRFNNFIIQLIAGNGAFHLWYMGMVLRVFLIFPVILWAAKKIHLMNIKIRTSTFIFLVCLYYPILKFKDTISFLMGKLIFGTVTDVQQRIINISILFYYLFFVLGIYFIFNFQYVKAKLLQYRTVVFIIYGFLFVYAYLREIKEDTSVTPMSILYNVLSITAFYLIAVSLAKKDKIYKILRFISDYSFAAYMAHVIVLNYVSNNIMVWLNTRNYLIVGILTLIITSLVTPAIIKLISYIPFSEYITGTRRSHIKTYNRDKKLKLSYN